MRYFFHAAIVPSIATACLLRAAPVSYAQTNQVKTFSQRQDALDKLRTDPKRNVDEFEAAVRGLMRDYPTNSEPYAYAALLIDELETDGALNRQGQAGVDRARALAKTMATSPAPEDFRNWANGVLYRHDHLKRNGSEDQPLALRFTALDGRTVDLAAMRGQVVLVDFWATWCPPCVGLLPRVKVAYETFRPQGFEIIGVSLDEDRSVLERFLKQQGIAWPQYFDGHEQFQNKIAQQLGIAGPPHMLLIDRKGVLRVDPVSEDHLEEIITRLLAEH